MPRPPPDATSLDPQPGRTRLDPRHAHCTSSPRSPGGSMTRHRHRPQRAGRRAAEPETVRHAGHPRRPPGPGPRRGTRPPGLPAGPVPRRDLPPREHVPAAPDPPRPLRDPATLEGFDFGASPKLPAAQIRDLAALRWLASGESVILYGPVGVGKSHVAQALAHLAIRAGAEARFMKTSRALAHLAGGQPTAPGTNGSRAHPPRRPGPGRLRHARAHPRPGRRPLRAHHRTSRQLTHPDLQPGPARTGTRCSPTPSSPNPSWTGSSTTATRSS